MNPSILFLVYTVAGVVVLAEALNKLERTCPFEPGLSWRERAVVWLKTLGWIALAIGAAGATGSIILYKTPPSFAEVATTSGFALLIIRSRIGEVLPQRHGRTG